ncbi:MAG: hypothetical protein V3R98_03965 [Alphaproteobacteria bacterium]
MLRTTIVLLTAMLLAGCTAVHNPHRAQISHPNVTVAPHVTASPGQHCPPGQRMHGRCI